MKRNINLITILGIILIMSSCGKKIEDVNFNPDVKILFQEVGDSNVVHVAKGVMDYTVKISVQSSASIISIFEIYSANAKTGNRDTLIGGTAKSFTSPEGSYAASYTITQLSENKCIKVVVTDTLGRVYEKNLLVKITPSVQFSSSIKIETVENYYGPYYASWLSGRVYMRKQAEIAKEIDFSLGDVVITTDRVDTIPVLVNPGQRAKFGLLTMAGLQETKFALSTLTTSQYNAISQIDEAAITSLTDPALDTVRIQSGKVYIFKTSNGKKGLINVSDLLKKSGTIENINGEWIKQTLYYEAKLTTKTVLP
ncbi:MAG: hypothetical protein QM727_03430 [Niabella sp.]